MKSHEDPSFANVLLQTHAETFEDEDKVLGAIDSDDDAEEGNAEANAAAAAKSTMARIQKLSELTVEEVAFSQQSKVLKRTLNKDNEHLFHGVLFYKVSQSVWFLLVGKFLIYFLFLL